MPKLAGPATSKRIGTEYGWELWERLQSYYKKKEMRGPWTCDEECEEEAALQGCEPVAFVAAAKKAWLSRQKEWKRDDDV